MNRPPKLNMVEVVTREHGEVFADEWIARSWDTGTITDACAKTGIIEWPYDPDGGGDDLSIELQDEIVQRVADQLRSTVVETFVRLANAVIEEERTRPEEPLIPPRVETVETVTPEQGAIFAEQIYRETADSEIFDTALSATHIMTFPDGPDGEETSGQKHFHEMTYEIRDRIHEETKQLIADAFVRVVGDVISRERWPLTGMNDFELVGSYADFLAEEEARGGAAVRVPDGTMEPVLFKDDVVRVEKLEATEDDVICVQVGNGHAFGYRTANALRRLHGPDIPLAGNEHVVGVATEVIDREIKPRRRGQTK